MKKISFNCIAILLLIVTCQFHQAAEQGCVAIRSTGTPV